MSDRPPWWAYAAGVALGAGVAALVPPLALVAIAGGLVAFWVLAPS